MNPPKRVFFLREERNRDTLLGLIKNLPLDQDKPMQVTVESFRPVRKKSQNDLMWSGPLKDIAEQAWLDGRQFSAEVWHEYFKANLLPDEFDPDLCKDGYQKFDLGPDGSRIMIGSTTQLTVKGMAQYLEALMAFGANLGVEFHTREER
jgi:hypothetical protein